MRELTVYRKEQQAGETAAAAAEASAALRAGDAVAAGSNKTEADRIVIRLSEFNRLKAQVQGFRRLQRLHKAQQEDGYCNVTEADDTGMLLRHIKTMVGYSNGKPEHFDALPVDVEASILDEDYM